MDYLAAQLRKSGVDPGNNTTTGDRVKRKVCMLGAAGVGKTSLVSRFVKSLFSESYVSSVGVSIQKKEVHIGDTELVMMIWDMAGEEDGAPVRLNQVRDASGLILVADGCSLSSLNVAESIRNRVLNEIGPRPIVLAVNKMDLFSEWEIRTEVLEYQSRNGLTIFTTSAKTGKGVELMFTHLARMIANRQDDDSDD